MIEMPLRVGAHQRGAAVLRRSAVSSPLLWEARKRFPR